MTLSDSTDQMNQSGTLQALCEKLDSSVDWQPLDPEDVSVYPEVSRQLENVVAPLEKLPELPSTSNAGRIATLLWSKHHQDRADLGYLTSHLRHPLAIVRLTAADALSEVLKRRGEDLTAVKSSFSAMEIYRTLEDQLRKETSTVVTHRLLHLVKQSRQAPQRNVKPPEFQRNPYVAGLPIRSKDAFYGRQETLDKIQSALASGTGVIIYGARRTGKTSLLYRILGGALGDSWFPVYIDMQAIAGTPLNNFLHSVAKSIEETFWERGLLMENTLPQPEGDTDFGFMRQFLARAAALLDSTRLLLLVDEFEVLKDFFQEKNAARQFQSIIEGTDHLQFVFAGSQKIENLEEKNLLFLLEVSKYITISFLTSEETRLLITQPAGKALSFAPEAVERIQALTAGHPYYTQLLCHTVYDVGRGSGRIQIEDVEEAARTFVRNPAPHLVLTWKTLSLSQKAICSSLAVLGSEMSPWVTPEEAVDHLKKQRVLRLEMREARDAIGDLQQLDWLKKKESDDRFGFTMELVRRWVAEKRSIWDLIGEYRREAYSQPPTVKARALSWLLDLLVLAAVWTLTLLGLLLPITTVWSPTVLLAVPAVLFMAYFLLALLLESATPGMLARRLRFVTSEGLPLRPGRKMLVALLLWARSVLWLTAIFHLIAHGIEAVSLVSGFFLLTLESVSGLLGYRDKHRRNLINQLTKTLLVLAPQERKR